MTLSTRSFCAMFLTLFIGSLIVADEKKTATDPKKEPATVTPVERKDKGSVARHERFVEISKKGNVDLLFLGDSITQGWEGNGKDVWKKHFEPLKAANFGIGGDRTEHVLWRITAGKELEGIEPKLAVLMIGTNNSRDNSAEEIADGVTKIVKTLNQAKPKMKVLVLAVFPRSATPGRELPKGTMSVEAKDLHPKIKQINDRISKLDDGKQVFYLDINAEFLAKDGSLKGDIMPDYLHLSPKGYEIWGNSIKAKVEALMK